MEENSKYNNLEEQEGGIDIITLVKGLWNGRKTIIIWTCSFMIIGLLVALFMPRKYKVETVMVPQMESVSNSSLSSLASLAGFDLSSMSSGSELSPLIYPQIVNSIPFRMELMYTPLHYEDVDTAVSMFTYTYEISKLSVFEAVAKYTIGLPYAIKKALRGKKEIVLPGEDKSDESSKLIVVTQDEMDLLDEIEDQITLMVDKKEGYLTLTVKGREKIQTAELALKAQQLLQDEITRFKIEKSQSELDYIQARYDEVKQEAEYYQERLAVITDRSQNMPSTRDRIERDRIQTKYSIANAIYNEMAKQLEQAKMQVKKNTPVFTIIQPVKVPNKSSNSKTRTLILWTFFGGVLGCGKVLAKSYMPKIKEMFASAGDSNDAAEVNEEHT
ncbi:MAG: lipopolysaccharide biosynthesis protein [Bacteroidaceae bacterium]|nr:lipopolysaccharide biosynthesis protein [Bacteroidaceae bacterium]